MTTQDDLTKLVNEAAKIKRALAANELRQKPKKERLNELQSEIKKHMSKNGVQSHKTKNAHVYITHNTRYIVEDYAAFRRYVLRFKALDLLPRACVQAAVKERMDEGKKVSGLATMESDTLNFRM